jgi:hypothetical protein
MSLRKELESKIALAHSDAVDYSYSPVLVSESRHDSETLIHLHELLGLDSSKSAAERAVDVKKRQVNLLLLFEGNQMIRLAEFQKSPEYKKWEAARSSLLVLHGANDGRIVEIGASWLSPVAVDQVCVLNEELSGPKCSVAYCFCQETDTPQNVICTIIYQLLQQRPKVLREGSDLEFIKLRIGGKEGSRENLDQLREVLLRIVDRIDNTVYLVIDRPELCGRNMETRLLRTIFRIVKEAKTEVKVLVVARQELWDAEKWVANDVSGTDMTFLILARRDQHAPGDG